MAVLDTWLELYFGLFPLLMQGKQRCDTLSVLRVYCSAVVENGWWQ